MHCSDPIATTASGYDRVQAMAQSAYSIYVPGCTSLIPNIKSEVRGGDQWKLTQQSGMMTKFHVINLSGFWDIHIFQL